LDARPLVRDLLALTRALNHLGDRVAWLAVLRAPWCGLALADLSALIEREPSGATVWSLIAESDARLAQLSTPGRDRVERVRDVMSRTLELDGRVSLRTRVEQAWWLLGGPACVDDQGALADAARYFERLAAYEEETAGALDLAQFERSLHKLYATADSAADPNLVLMTIYKAKGLEFDHVVVPGLARRPHGTRADLLRWLELPRETGSELLIAPINATGDVSDEAGGVYRWLQRLNDSRQTHEMDRLLYVAATRARSQLHWVTCVASNNGALRPAVRGSLLSRLAPVIASDLHAAVQSAAGAGSVEQVDARAFDQALRRLPLNWRPPVPPPSVQWRQRDAAIEANDAVEFSWAGETARRVGIVVHRWLQAMADDELRGWDAARVERVSPLIERELAAGGLASNDLATARQRAVGALTNALADPRARWLLGTQSEARNEWRVSVRDARGVRRVIIDRVFLDADGQQWIVDYKTGAHEGAEVESFLDREQLRYAAQLESYAQALGGAAQLGLYFPLLNGWRAWSRDDGH
ncbi:MAG TPA: 3'-5' exonuclease, partial [Burkholderiaceae bacterium]|nr:3'-5' exonuclease [Burkholderiaceae bacterium]